MPIGIIFSIPLLMWIIQKATKTTGKKADYLRRRAFGWCVLIIFFLSLLTSLPLIIQGIKLIQTDSQGIMTYKFAKFTLFRLGFWGAILSTGFSRDIKENRGYFLSIWESYKPEYVVLKVNSKKDQPNQ
jgi:hypothetical protein